MSMSKYLQCLLVSGSTNMTFCKRKSECTDHWKACRAFVSVDIFYSVLCTIYDQRFRAYTVDGKQACYKRIYYPVYDAIISY